MATEERGTNLWTTEGPGTRDGGRIPLNHRTVTSGGSVSDSEVGVLVEELRQWRGRWGRDRRSLPQLHLAPPYCVGVVLIAQTAA